MMYSVYPAYWPLPTMSIFPKAAEVALIFVAGAGVPGAVVVGVVAPCAGAAASIVTTPARRLQTRTDPRAPRNLITIKSFLATNRESRGGTFWRPDDY